MNRPSQSPIKSKMGGVFIHVTDLKKSVEWYANILGFKPDFEKLQSPVYNIPITGTTSLTLDDHAFDPTFIHRTSLSPIFNFLVDDIDVAYDFIKSNNIEIVREIERVAENFAWFNFKDPDGNVIMACTG